MNTRADKKFSIAARIRSFRFALLGLREFFSTQHNARVHLLSAAAAIALGVWLKISTVQWCMIALSIALVVAAELLNTAIEYLTDFVSPGHHEKAGKIKDLGAAAVLICAIGAFACGLFIFLPLLIDKFHTLVST